MTPTGQNLLRSRLQLLREDVEALLEGLSKIASEVLTYGGPRVQSHVELRNRAVAHLNAITKALTASPSQQAWTEYNRIRDEVTQVNQEVLEIVAGLAIHRENVDAKICWVVRRFLEDISGASLGLTVFTARDLNFPTLARLTRVRFPVKSIWTLPLAAHQFANLQIKDQAALEAYASDAARREAQNSQLPASGNAAQNEILRRKSESKAYSRWIQLMSDCLAVFFTGPCYAASAILMRLSPLGVELEDDSQASDIDRAYAILAMLRRMDAPIDGDDPPYTEFIDWLEARWKGMLTAAGSVGPAPDRAAELDSFVSGLARLADQEVAYAKYPLMPLPYVNSGSWSSAQIWAQDWISSVKANSPLTTPDVSVSGTVRDAFNAGWLVYSKIPGQPGEVNALAAAVKATCDRIVAPYLSPPQTMQPPGKPGARPQPGIT